MSMQNRPVEIRVPVMERYLSGLYWPGEGTPIIALHGWLDNAHSFLPLMEQAKADKTLLGNRPVLALDFCGHGLSEHFPHGEMLHFVNHVQDVVFAAKHMQWERFSLLGHSMGAAVCLLVAATFPEKVTELVMIDAMGPQITAEGELASTLKKAVMDVDKRTGKKPPYYATFDEAVAARMKGIFPVTHSAARLLCERGMYFDAQGWTWRADQRLRFTSALRFSEQQVKEFSQNVQCDSLFIGAKQGIAGARDLSQRLGYLNQVEVVMLEGGHHLHMEEVVPVLTAIEAFYGRQ